MVSEYNKIKIHMIVMGLVLIGGINWVFHAFGYNLVDKLSQFINGLFNSNFPLNTIIYVIVGLAAIYLAMRRDTWLPFLGKNVLPDVLVPLVTPKISDTFITVKVPPNSKVAYWAALPSATVQNVEAAYGNYSNSGVVMADSKGNAVLNISKGNSYIVPSGREVPRHIHYRVLGLEHGMIDRIQTLEY